LYNGSKGAPGLPQAGFPNGLPSKYMEDGVSLRLRLFKRKLLPCYLISRLLHMIPFKARNEFSMNFAFVLFICSSAWNANQPEVSSSSSLHLKRTQGGLLYLRALRMYENLNRPGFGIAGHLHRGR
jgi:hypothetical protein